MVRTPSAKRPCLNVVQLAKQAAGKLVHQRHQRLNRQRGHLWDAEQSNVLLSPTLSIVIGFQRIPTQTIL